jgi:hypothetical protein
VPVSAIGGLQRHKATYPHPCSALGTTAPEVRSFAYREAYQLRGTSMRFVGISLAAVGLFSLVLSVVIANAVLGPVHQNGKPAVALGEWTTTVVRE